MLVDTFLQCHKWLVVIQINRGIFVGAGSKPALGVVGCWVDSETALGVASGYWAGLVIGRVWNPPLRLSCLESIFDPL